MPRPAVLTPGPGTINFTILEEVYVFIITSPFVFSSTLPPPLPPNGAREWYSHKFHNLDSPYHSDASHQNGNNKPCDFHEVKNIKLLTHDGRHTKTNCKGHTSDSIDLKMINNKY